ncbi:hypothetical protein [Neorhizobium sp. P12A]|uniref:hypothetical protein n=1 Tax=Neorhizobium sp. P12A TaxID=2268027 RepID=UPI00165D67B4|nr:hypothetical protein [Neorhizobium sp. P12A]
MTKLDWANYRTGFLDGSSSQRRRLDECDFEALFSAMTPPPLSFISRQSPASVPRHGQV